MKSAVFASIAVMTRMTMIFSMRMNFKTMNKLDAQLIVLRALLEGNKGRKKKNFTKATKKLCEEIKSSKIKSTPEIEKMIDDVLEEQDRFLNIRPMTKKELEDTTINI